MIAPDMEQVKKLDIKIHVSQGDSSQSLPLVICHDPSLMQSSGVGCMG